MRNRTSKPRPLTLSIMKLAAQIHARKSAEREAAYKAGLVIGTLGHFKKKQGDH